MTKGVLTSVKSKEVKIFGNFSKTSIWKEFAGKLSGLRTTVRENSIHKGLRSRIVRAPGFSWYELQKTRPDEDDVFGQIIPSCRENTFSRLSLQSRAFAAIPGGTIIGPVIEVQIVKILDQYGLVIAIPSPNDGEQTSYEMISRGRSRFVDESHMPKAEPRSSAELLTECQKSEGGESCLAQSKTCPTTNKEICADTLSITPSQASSFSQRTIPTTERKWTVIPANSSHGGALPTAVSKIVTRMVRHYDQDERQSDAALQWDTIRPILLKAFAKY